MKCKMLSSLVKVFADEQPRAAEIGRVEGFLNETVSFQLAFTDETTYFARITADFPVRVRTVHSLPLSMTFSPEIGDDILRNTPGLYPDRLADAADGIFHVCAGQWRSLWLDIEGAQPGIHRIKLNICNMENTQIAAPEMTVEIFAASLPAQTLRHTKFFHADSLAGYYHIDAFGERHWKICENFIKTAVKRGLNMIMTPTFTLPLDTAVGGERLTTQLVDVVVENGKYAFGFDKLDRWISMSLKCGVEYFEIAHLFTQWGARAAPKVMATVDGEYKRIFGWDTDALGEEYGRFLAAYLPALTGWLKKRGIAGKCYFHISDEPGALGDSLELYKRARAAAVPYLAGFKVIDALAHIELYKNGDIDMPVPDTYHVEEFLEYGMREPWTYYCCGQYKGVSNQFAQMPSSRNRIFGVQLYKYGIEGFLHWGYNFYGSRLSLKQINPYASLDEGGFPPGDAWQVYPGPDGMPEESIRLMVAAQAFYDMRALQMLEKLTGRDFVLNLIEGGLPEPLTFSVYPRGDEYILNLRHTVNTEIMKRLG